MTKLKIAELVILTASALLASAKAVVQFIGYIGRLMKLRTATVKGA